MPPRGRRGSVVSTKESFIKKLILMLDQKFEVLAADVVEMKQTVQGQETKLDKTIDTRQEEHNMVRQWQE